LQFAFIVQTLVFIGAVLALFAIVPLSTWAATGRWRDALRAAREYGRCLLLMVAVSAVFVLAAAIGSAP
jgi:hypothetical protein